MFNKTSTALLLSMALIGAAQGQTCSCSGNGTKLGTAEIQALLSNKMVCASVGGEQWQEWHNGNAGGPLVDYKKGPGDQVDPSATVGSFSISSDTVTYTYGSQSYQYEVCQTPSGTTFCGAPFGGRNITGAIVSGSPGLRSCNGVTPAAATARPIQVPKAIATPKPSAAKP
jgi:hypothetical protein